MRKYDAVIAGYTCIDFIPEFRRDVSSTNISELLKPGKLIEIGSMNYVLGGAVPNTGLTMKKFNKHVFLNGLIGSDFIGKIAAEHLGKYGISEGITMIKDEGTAFSIVLAPPGVDRIFLESPGCNRIFSSEHINYNAVSQSLLFHFGYPPLLRQFYLNGGLQLSGMFSKIRKMGVITSLDFSLPDPESESGKINWLEIMENTLPFVDIFLPSLEEAIQIMMPEKYIELIKLSDNTDLFENVGQNLIRELGKKIINMGVKILLIKAGKHGSYLITGNISKINQYLKNKLEEEKWNNLECWCNAYPVDPDRFINASGAGDTSVAAFLSAILDGENPENTIKYANMAGRNNLYCQDIFSDLSDWETMKKEINTLTNEIFYF